MSRGGQCRERGGDALQQTLRLAGDMHDLIAALAAADQRQIAPRQSPLLGEQRDQRGVGAIRGGRRGDQYVIVQVVVPKDLSPEQKALLRKVGGLTGKPEKVSKGFFEKLRNAISLD